MTYENGSNNWSVDRGGIESGPSGDCGYLFLMDGVMSIPIKYCFLVEACGSEELFDKLHPIMKRNLDGGHFSVFPCNHDPPCRELTEEEQVSLMRRFREPVIDKRQGR